MTTTKVRASTLNNAFLESLDWTALKGAVASKDFLAMMNVMELYMDPRTGLVEDRHPAVFATLANASDNPNYHQAMNGPDADGYLLAMEEGFER